MTKGQDDKKKDLTQQKILFTLSKKMSCFADKLCTPLFLVDKIAQKAYNAIVKDSQTVAWETSHEESPSTTEQECRITSCEGDFKESATEIYRNESCKGGNAG